MRLIDTVHERCVVGRRVRVLAGHLAPLLPQGGSVLDVGCGDGVLTRLLSELRPDVRLQGVEVAQRPGAAWPCDVFDGATLPYPEASFDAVLFVDVLHHTRDPRVLLREARRVMREAIVLKDHLRQGFLAGPTLRFMDWVGNARHGVALPFNYWTLAQWQQTWRELDLTPTAWQAQLGLYPAPAGWWFDRQLHFLAKLQPCATALSSANRSATPAAGGA